MAESARIIEVAAGLVFRDGRLLIAQRKADSHLGGLWEFPGGKREPNESWDACLKRELEEELGIEVQVGGEFEQIVHTYPEKTVHLRFFTCSVLSGEPQAIDCAAVEWIGPEQIRAFRFPPADDRLIGRLSSEAWPK